MRMKSALLDKSLGQNSKPELYYVIVLFNTSLVYSSLDFFPLSHIKREILNFMIKMYSEYETQVNSYCKYHHILKDL